MAEQLDALLGKIVEGRDGWRRSDELTRAAPEKAVTASDIQLDQDQLSELAYAMHRLHPWDDSPAALDMPFSSVRADRSPMRLRPHWANCHVEADSVGIACCHPKSHEPTKPAAAVYQSPLDLLGIEPDRALMIAAHPWDLHTAAATGMHTAFVHGPGEGVPVPEDTFDLQQGDLQQGDLQQGDLQQGDLRASATNRLHSP